MGSDRPLLPESARARALATLFVVALALATAWFRAGLALSDPQFDARDPAGLLKSDPALLVHLAERIAENGGSTPASFAADTQLEYPDAIDVARRFPLGQLRVVAWAQIVFGGETSLHVTALWVSALAMGLALAGTYLLARELSGSAVLGACAALLAAATPAFHRSIGFVLVDEDFFWPLFALHLGLAARAARVRTPAAVVAAAAAAAAALATWHAAGFFLALEAAVVLGGLVATGRSALAVRGGALVPLVLVVTAIAVPFLREVGAAFSFPLAVAAGLAVAAWCRTPRAARIAGVVATVLVVALGRAFAGADGAYGHVFALLAAKLAHLGVRPPSAAGLDPDVRILWQGPFETPGLVHAATVLSLAGLIGVAAAVRIATGPRGARRAPETLLVALFALALGGAWFVERALVLPALLAPPLAACVAARMRRGTALLAIAALVQVALCAAWAASYRNPWYHAPVQRQAEIRWMVREVARVVPRDAAVAADFVSGAAILQHSGNPICFSPKWEAAEPRRRAREFVDAFHHATPDAFRRLLVERYRARWLVVDRFTLQYLARWSAGLPAGSFEPLPGTAAAALLSQDDASLRAIPGYELVARSPSEFRQSNGAPTDFYRIFRLAP